ncbi:glycosyltransferase family 2 protein [Tahibacter amnicola]|uniref:Glycosyltransferase n=1 Tax=Tahibacter amnicola TaxID=2976241 RepID=A0ABY6BGQ7_9GAMM|nr:glycosyltransferase family 2 protein [Tahibacter amnicola]UXI69213.1 glycosyltransferase [Tahibacter amnicola]
MSKLYLRRRGDQYSEHGAIQADSPASSETGWTRFRLSADDGLETVRFDPSAQAGIYRLRGMRWLDAATGAELLRYSAQTLRDEATGVGGVRLPGESPDALEFWTFDDDPYIEVPWPRALDGQMRSISLEVEWNCDPMSTADAAAIAMDLLGDDEAALLASVAKGDGAAGNGVLDLPSLAASQRIVFQRLAEWETRHVAQARLHEAAVTQLREHIDGLHSRALEERLRLVRAGEAARVETGIELQQLTARVDTTHAALSAQLAEVVQRLDQALQQHAAREQVLEAALRRQSEQLDELLLPPSFRVRRALKAMPSALRRIGARTVRRLRGWTDFIRIRTFMLSPLGDVEPIADAPVGTAWRSTGDDPRFALVPQQTGSPSAGWYVLRLALKPREGYAFVEPSLYVDYGVGMTEAGKVTFRLDPDKPTQDVLIKLAGDARAIRFDPSTQPCSFDATAFSLRKMTRPEAALRLVGPVLRELVRSPRHLAMAFRDALKALRAGGVAEVESRLRALHESRSRDASYACWVARFDTLSREDLARMAGQLESLATRPTFSLIVPVYNTPARWLHRCIDSVLEQTYPNWELCIADDASTQAHVRQILDEYAARDARIRVVYRERNGHISAASNSALELATGRYVALLDHDDELPAHALFLVAERLQREPDLKLIYSDEDKIDESGRRYDPYFKPDWNPDLFHSQNFVCHLGVYDTQLVRSVGGFRVGYEGSQDYDLALRCVEKLEPGQIGHIPHILYHWRSVAGSTALAAGEKSYTNDASQRALQDHFARQKQAVLVERTAQGYFRCRYALPETLPTVTLIIPTRDRVDLLRMSVQSLLERTDYPALDILIVDNQSCEARTLAYFEELKNEPRVKVLRYDEPFNFSAINNFAAKQATGEVIGLVNNDIEVIHADWLREMVSHAIRPEVGGVGAKLYYPDGRIQHAGVVVGFGGVAGHSYQRMARDYPGQMNRANLVQAMSSVTAACLLLRREVFEAVDGLDAGLQVAFNDIDFCLRILDQGLRIVWTPFAELYHHESASRGYEDSPEKLARFHREIRFMQERYGERLTQDPAYNPNLALEGEPFELAWPPRAVYSFRAGEAN